MDGDDVRVAAASSRAALEPMTGRDWTAAAGDLQLSVAEVVAHVGETLLRYATDLAAGPAAVPTMELRVRPSAPPAALLATVVTAADVLAAVLDAAPPGARGFHPAGTADTSGFAAMACDELLVHTDDAARGLGLVFEPDVRLAGHTLRRLFPWAPTDGRSWPALRWANGRAPLGERPRLSEWYWHCAPIEEWDGTAPGFLGR
ncbi:maleylpyruvate isomerase N-terminal domain-containing protein [Pseudonocardia bannensis]|uniref:Mycothiol-dependent maleylpyruvate isomerase metal-binding domain-containing protein n=1 Tax=Pseudonocardia bannensis TaxID=630973 RepID=A0A848DF62_9PSEU|nr:maleylpyruvate isomerase N-terminal domain-containing protein [Pseudonocardia bannensis]NMH91257.1 hypothetical protein [Pseudonocardia bannensis]